jgi:hypothetical protein
MFKTSFYGATDRTKVACEDCDWQGEACELEGISDFSERVAPGEICPAGECPECGALAHVARGLRTGYARMTGSVECPHCHWGFAPSVIEQHLREKHSVKPHMWRGTLNGV